MKPNTLMSYGLSLVVALVGAVAAGENRQTTGPAAARPELEYLKAVNRQPPQDPQLLFLLMAQFANANRQGEGAEFLSARLKEFDSRLSDPQKSLYLAAIGMLRAGHAGNVPLLKRAGWVRETIGILDRATKLSGGKIYVVRWISGVVSAQLPARFDQKAKAFEDLNWCSANAGQAPGPEWS